MVITLISSILAFVAGFLFFLYATTVCTDENWKKLKNAIEKARKKNDV